MLTLGKKKYLLSIWSTKIQVLSLILITSVFPDIVGFSRAIILFVLIVILLLTKAKIIFSRRAVLIISLLLVDSVFNFGSLYLACFYLVFYLNHRPLYFWRSYTLIFKFLSVFGFILALPVYLGHSYELPVEMLKKVNEGFVGKDFYTRTPLNSLIITGDIHPIISNFHLFRYCGHFMEPAIYGFLSLPVLWHDKFRLNIYNAIFYTSLLFTFSLTFYVAGFLIFALKYPRVLFYGLAIILPTIIYAFDDGGFSYFLDKLSGNSLNYGYQGMGIGLYGGSLNQLWGTSTDTISVLSILLWIPSIVLTLFSAPYFMPYVFKSVFHFVPNLVLLLWLEKRK